MDELNEAVRSALSGDNRGREMLERAISEELGVSPTPASTSAAVVRRLQAIEEVRALMKRETTGA